MNDFDLTPEEIKKQYPEEIIKKADTFKPQGISEQVARDYLKTEAGELYLDRVYEASPDTPLTEIRKRAVGHLMSGSEVPRVEIINEPLVKIVPTGQTPSPFSPFWAKEADLDAAVKSGQNLSQHFGLPIASEAVQYDVYKITPKAPTEVFVGTLVPTHELDGLVKKTGGATQYLTPNRKLYDDAVFVKSVANRIDLEQTQSLTKTHAPNNTAFQDAYKRDQLSSELEVKTTRPNSVDTKHINNVLAAEHKNVTEYQAERQAKAQIQETGRVQSRSVTPAEPHIPNSPTFETPHINKPPRISGVQAAGVAGFALGVAQDYSEVSQKMDAAPTYHDKIVTGVEEGGNKLARGTVAGSSAIVGGALTSELPIVGTVAGATGGYIAGGEWYDRKVAPLVKTGLTVPAEFFYTHGTEQGRLEKQIENKLDEISKSTNQANTFEQQEQLKHIRAKYNTVAAKNQFDIDTQHFASNNVDEFIHKNPRFREMSKSSVTDDIVKQINDGVAKDLAASQSITNAARIQTEQEKRALIGLSEQGQLKAASIYEKNKGASWTDAIELATLEAKRDFVAMGFGGSSPLGESLYQRKREQIEQANHKADPNYGKDPNDIRIDQLAAQAKAAHQAQQALFKAVEKLDIDSKIQYYQIKAQQQRKDPNHYAHPHDAASIASHLDTQRRNNARAAQNDKTYTYKESHGQAKSAAPVVHTVVRHRPASPPEMGKGAHGPQVKNLQASLNAAGMHLAVTGRYDKTTIQAVKAFQKEHHLKVDGTIGKKDVKVIGQVIKAQNAHHAIEQLAQLNGHEAPKQAKGLYNLKEGVHNDQVKEVQLALKQLGYELPVDGQYDKATLQAVKAFQKEQHLKVDGKIDVQDVMAIAAAVSKHQQKIGKEQSVEPSLQKSAGPTQSKNAEQTQLDQMISVMAATPAFAAMSREEQTAMAQGMMNVAQQTPAPSQTVEAIKPDHAALEVASSRQAAQVATPTAQTFDAQSAPKPAQTDDPIQLPPRIATLQEQIKGHLTNHPEFGNQLAHLSHKDQQTAIALATYEATHNRAKAVDYVWISPKGEVCMSFDGDKGFSGAMNMNQVQNNDANQVFAASVNLQQTQQHNLAQKQEHSQRQAA